MCRGRVSKGNYLLDCDQNHRLRFENDVQAIIARTQWPSLLARISVHRNLLLRSAPAASATCYIQLVPFTANEVGTEFVMLFQLPLKPIPLWRPPAGMLPL